MACTIQYRASSNKDANNIENILKTFENKG
jgi:hypothetical protein